MAMQFWQSAEKSDIADDIVSLLDIKDSAEKHKMWNELIKMRKRGLGNLHHYLTEKINRIKK